MVLSRWRCMKGFLKVWEIRLERGLRIGSYWNVRLDTEQVGEATENTSIQGQRDDTGHKAPTLYAAGPGLRSSTMSSPLSSEPGVAALSPSLF